MQDTQLVELIKVLNQHFPASLDLLYDKKNYNLPAQFNKWLEFEAYFVADNSGNYSAINVSELGLDDEQNIKTSQDLEYRLSEASSILKNIHKEFERKSLGKEDSAFMLSLYLGVLEQLSGDDLIDSIRIKAISDWLFNYYISVDNKSFMLEIFRAILLKQGSLVGVLHKYPLINIALVIYCQKQNKHVSPEEDFISFFYSYATRSRLIDENTTLCDVYYIRNKKNMADLFKDSKFDKVPSLLVEYLMLLSEKKKYDLISSFSQELQDQFNTEISSRSQASLISEQTQQDDLYTSAEVEIVNVLDQPEVRRKFNFLNMSLYIFTFYFIFTIFLTLSFAYPASIFYLGPTLPIYALVNNICFFSLGIVAVFSHASLSTYTDLFGGNILTSQEFKSRLVNDYFSSLMWLVMAMAFIVGLTVRKAPLSILMGSGFPVFIYASVFIATLSVGVCILNKRLAWSSSKLDEAPMPVSNNYFLRDISKKNKLKFSIVFGIAILSLLVLNILSYMLPPSATVILLASNVIALTVGICASIYAAVSAFCLSPESINFGNSTQATFQLIFLFTVSLVAPSIYAIPRLLFNNYGLIIGVTIITGLSYVVNAVVSLLRMPADDSPKSLKNIIVNNSESKPASQFSGEKISNSEVLGSEKEKEKNSKDNLNPLPV
ncbi:MAG: hypothetical protein VX335_03725 [Pseudomonadota bacterium]|nr:hypothetical protein [Pseudomonadota bacterium]